MNLVLVHLGDDNFPLYIFDNLRQIRRFYDGNIFVVVPNNICRQHSAELYSFNCSIIATEDLEGYEKNVNLETITSDMKKTEQPSFNYLLDKGYWKYTLQRFLFLEALTKELSLTDVIHVENDVTIYEDLNQLENKLYQCYPKSIAINPVDPNHAAGAFIYYHGVESIGFLNDLFLEWIQKGEKQNIKELDVDMITEMNFLNHFQKIIPERVKYLPLLPENHHFENTNIFNSVFDGASWGQYVGGLPEIHADQELRFFPKSWVGRELLQKKYTLVWKQDDLKRRIPYVLNMETQKETKINNLHVHCKRFKDFI